MTRDGGGACPWRVFVRLYSGWRTVAMNAAFFAAYYLLFYGLILHSNDGYFLLTIPFWLLLVFVLASSALATVAVSYIRISVRRRGVPGVAGSPVGVVVGAFVASCSCNLPLLAPVMYFIGLNSLEVSGVISFLAAYQQAIVEGIVLLDLASIYYYLRQISRSGAVRAVDSSVKPAN
ncbi:MAG: hypothetical protein JRN58_08880 [Nitrososphaerota archaeon]|nr:hypothetical protein [Nitrososphaerota archaeon]MDG6966760.1 hypothetical protein [Nitrososphaerota archaeon]MDG6979179.1 hypothetical protein [Nitrososphaerota archaeon]